MTAEAADMVERILGRFSDHVTTIEVHLDDENGAKGGADGARLGQRHWAVSCQAAHQWGVAHVPTTPEV